MKNKDYRHGDVGLIEVKSVPGTAKKLDAKVCKCATFEVCAKHYVFAHGEISGHAHRCDSKKDKLAFYQDGDDFYVENLGDEPAILAQTMGVNTIMDIAHLEKCYQIEELHAPMVEAIPPKECRLVIFPMEANWWTGEIERARD